MTKFLAYGINVQQNEKNENTQYSGRAVWNSENQEANFEYNLKQKLWILIKTVDLWPLGAQLQQLLEKNE